MMINVRLGYGTFDDFGVIHDGKWPVSPRIGETIILGGPESFGSFIIKNIAYQITTRDELVGVMVLVEKV